MRIVSIGGGPAGLSFALLMKKAFPACDIEVHEKNQADDAFGWGVVFSKETLGTLRDADPEMYAQMEERFAYWDDIDIHLDGKRERSTGHGFCGLSRKDLLAILQGRCEALGIAVHFGSELPTSPLPQAELIIAADGVHSPIRERYRKDFQPTVEPTRCKFTWLGTTRELTAFTFIFKDTPFGLFQVHAYPFTHTPLAPSGARSTFIVECREEVWKRAGLDAMSEPESVAFLEKLFELELGGHALCPNKSIWRTFPNIRCEKWTRDNLVLLGDAAHTAHFSIGSGTKLAMEDAIALVDAFRVSGLDVPAALATYEAQRRPEVAKIQRAAQTSLEWFENAARYRAQPVEQFAFNLLTRSKRITWANLRARDARLVAAADLHFAKEHHTPLKRDGAAPPPLFTPLKIRGVTLKNRVVVSPMCQYSATDGVPDDWHLVHLGSRATGGAALVFTEMTNVAPEGRITHGCAGIWNQSQATAWTRVVDFVHRHSGAKIGLQLAHAGRKASCSLPWEGDTTLGNGPRAWQTYGPSALPFQKGWHTPRPMDASDLAHVKRLFVEGARRTDACGFDVLELHMAHGYLLSSFLSPLSNHRTDEYGGSAEKRARYPLEVFEAVRAVWPVSKLLFVRVSATDWLEKGQRLEDTIAFAKELKKRGCDVVDVSTGGNSPESKPEYGRMYQLKFAEAVKFGAEVTVMTVGGVQSADHVNTIVGAGRADLCALARPHLSDPYLVARHAQEEHVSIPDWPKQYLAVAP